MASFDIQTLKDRLLVKYPAFASAIVNANYYEKPVKTLCTDGKDIYYDSNFLNSLSIDEQLFVLAHEICHIRSNHIMRSKDKNPKLWNIATDAVINVLLKEDGLTIPQNVINMPDAVNYSAEEYYEKLLKEQEKNQNENSSSEKNQTQSEKEQSSGSNGANNSNASKQESSSEENQTQSEKEQSSSSNGANNSNASRQESSSEENQTQSEKEQSSSSNGANNSNASKQESSSEENQTQSEKEQSSSSNELNSSNESVQGNSSQNNTKDEEYNNPSNVDDHSMWSKALEKESKENDSKENEEVVDEQELFSENRKEKIENLKKLKEELLKESMQAGNSTNEDKFSLDNIGRNKPLIDWRTLLRKSVNIKLNWDTRTPEVEYGVLVPKLRRKAYPRTEILLDTSGSIDDEMLKNFLRECKYILQNTEMWVGCFDTKFYGFQKIDSEKDIDNMTFYGRGGTNFEVAVNAFTKRSDNRIIFTDGYADMPKEKANAIWVVFGEEKINPLGGQVIYINQEQLKQLHSSNSSMKR